jgi:hypothetical protein
MYHVETRDTPVRAPLRLIKCLLTPTNLPNSLRERACEQVTFYVIQATTGSDQGYGWYKIWNLCVPRTNSDF